MAILWGAERETPLRLAVPRASVRAAMLDGADVPVTDAEGGSALRVGPRRVTLYLPSLAPADAARVVAEATGGQ